MGGGAGVLMEVLVRAYHLASAARGPPDNQAPLPGRAAAGVNPRQPTRPAPPDAAIGPAVGPTSKTYFARSPMRAKVSGRTRAAWSIAARASRGIKAP